MHARTQQKRIAILQSNYIPWKGYFDVIAAVDEFVIFDEVQYTRRDWRNRNKIVLGEATHWLSIPIASKRSFHVAVDEVKIAQKGWARKHWTSLCHAYRKAVHFEETSAWLGPDYKRAEELERLTDVNELLLRSLCAQLEIATPLTRTAGIERHATNPTDRLIEICLARGATHYLSGPAAKAYLDQARFRDAGVQLEFASYDGYPVYSQQRASFEHGVSMLDLVFRFGRNARDHLKSVNKSSTLALPAD